MFDIKALDFEEWAKTYQEKYEFPRLIYRLIWATCSKISKLEMPAGEHVYLPGFDGIVECSSGNDFVPTGVSVWELSTEDQVTTKANEDYEKRTQNSPGIMKLETSFVFATPRRWTTCGEWEAEKEAQRIWRLVRGLWSHHLERWMDTARWIAASFGRRAFGRVGLGLRSIDMIWDDYADVPHPSGNQLSPNFVLADRDETRDYLLGWLASDIPTQDRIIRFSGPSEREGLDFIAAAIRSLEEPKRTMFSSRVLAVDDVASAQCLRGINPDHTIIATGNVVPHAVRLWKESACRIVVLHANSSQDGLQPLPGIQCIELPPMSRDTIIRVVIEIGYSPEGAAEVCEANCFDYEQVRKAIFLY